MRHDGNRPTFGPNIGARDALGTDMKTPQPLPGHLPSYPTLCVSHGSAAPPAGGGVPRLHTLGFPGRRLADAAGAAQASEAGQLRMELPLLRRPADAGLPGHRLGASPCAQAVQICPGLGERGVPQGPLSLPLWIGARWLGAPKGPLGVVAVPHPPPLRSARPRRCSGSAPCWWPCPRWAHGGSRGMTRPRWSCWARRRWWAPSSASSSS